MTPLDLVKAYEDAANKCYRDWLNDELAELSISDAMRKAGVLGVVAALRDEFDKNGSPTWTLHQILGSDAVVKAAGGPTPDNGRPLVEGADKETSQSAAPAADVCVWTKRSNQYFWTASCVNWGGYRKMTRCPDCGKPISFKETP